MSERVEPDGTVATRWSAGADAEALAEVHRLAWRYAYAGIIPGVQLNRMIARRGPIWWGRMHDRGMRALVLTCGGGIAGYATLGRSRGPDGSGQGPTGEIFELYLRPEMHGVGFGRRLFCEARLALASHGLTSLMVWALAENEVACRFYEAMGGRAVARGVEGFCGVPLQKVGFAWE
jgi:ribosomal protein S18 acetylase RimI-like enzyme